ncbi:uncharacterized protein LOC121391954 [Gigantopelta aegis]|uniref:uncharacterized protein LOC121391954 n=1 Tax=Gigantopelta aegis TaxID=1735272 RepID=UPI001B889C31|nr:uncharacterized protein LOC121391954 [Gigantopelta aegis]
MQWTVMDPSEDLVLSQALDSSESLQHLHDADDLLLSQALDEVCKDGEDDVFHFRFKKPLTESELNEKLDTRISKSTRYKYDWVLTVFKRWQDECSNRSITDNLQIPRECLTGDIVTMTPKNLNIALKYFIFEVNKQDGSDYPAVTLYGLFGTIQSYMKCRNSDSNLFEDAAFKEARAALDAVMKERSAAGLGASTRKRTEVISESEENMLWDKGLLGDNTPQQLLDTILYLTGLHFSLRGGSEHRQLRLLKNPQISGPFVDTCGRSYLLYKEDASKSNQGGIKHRKVLPKEVRAYDNPSNPSRCYVRLFTKYKKYCQTVAQKCDAFYFTPLKNVKKDAWFSSIPVGHNTLQATVKRLCEAAGITGRKTNHSLRATSATRLFQANIDEQLICEQTGHRSDAVRTYKRPSDRQKAEVSDFLYVDTKNMHTVLQPKSASQIRAQVPPAATETNPQVPPAATKTPPRVPPAATYKNPQVPPAVTKTPPQVPPAATDTNPQVPPAVTKTPPQVPPAATEIVLHTPQAHGSTKDHSDTESKHYTVIFNFH